MQRPDLLISAPIELALAELDARTVELRRYAPNSDAADTLSAVLERMRAALAEARTSECWIGVEEARALQGLRSREAVTAQARRGDLRAQKNGKGEWQIDPRSLPRLAKAGAQV